MRVSVKFALIAAVIAMATVALELGTWGPAALGGNIFSGLQDTLSGYPTWDLDMINVRGLTGNEHLDFTGEDVHVAVLDSGLVPNWRDYFPESRIATDLGIGFHQNLVVTGQDVAKDGPVHGTSYIGDVNGSHGTHVVSTIIGYFHYDPRDGLPPLVFTGVAPRAKIIPVKVLSTYNLPQVSSEPLVFGTDEAIAAGIDYVTGLKLGGVVKKVVINMSLGGPSPLPLVEAAINRAIKAGIIVVASAGNARDAGMSWPGAYPQVISVGAAGWTNEWFGSKDTNLNRAWFAQTSYKPYVDVAEGKGLDNETYVTAFSSRQLPGQQLDVLAPGSWVRGPFPVSDGYSHLPWWSKGEAFYTHPSLRNFYFVGGTSMAAPHVAGLAALMLQKNEMLTQAKVEKFIKSTALSIGPGSRSITTVIEGEATPINVCWEGYKKCESTLEATGAGLIQADEALLAVP